jgi:multidrug efflux pump subunit AcrA (membrane-fusion protein)
LLKQQAEMQDDTKKADAAVSDAQAKLLEAKAKAAESQDKISRGHFAPKPGVAPENPEPETSLDVATAQAKLMDAQTKRRQVELEAARTKVEDQNRDEDRLAKERDTMIGLAKEFVEKPETTTGPDGGKKTKGAPKHSNAGEKAVKVRKQIVKGLASGNKSE